MNKPIYTVRVTQLESFRMWMHGQTEQNERWNTEQRVFDTISGLYTGSVKADYGTAGHSIIENKHLNQTPTGGYQFGKIVFTQAQAKPIIKYANDHPLAIREVPVSKLYVGKKIDIIMTGTIDALEGIFIRDNKFKFSQFDMQEYVESAQHRFYMNMAGLDHFFYDFFRVGGFDAIEDCPKAHISDVESLHVMSYPHMEMDLQAWLDEFEDWVTFKNYLGYLRITPAKYKKILNGDQSLRKILSGYKY